MLAWRGASVPVPCLLCPGCQFGPAFGWMVSLSRASAQVPCLIHLGGDCGEAGGRVAGGQVCAFHPFHALDVRSGLR
jgi:hypothetical protein